MMGAIENPYIMRHIHWYPIRYEKVYCTTAFATAGGRSVRVTVGVSLTSETRLSMAEIRRNIEDWNLVCRVGWKGLRKAR